MSKASDFGYPNSSKADDIKGYTVVPEQSALLTDAVNRGKEQLAQAQEVDTCKKIGGWLESNALYKLLPYESGGDVAFYGFWLREWQGIVGLLRQGKKPEEVKK